MKNTMKLLTFLLVILGKTALADAKIEGSYSFQLYFGDSKPYTDELTFVKDKDGLYKGIMHVPNDFDANLENIVVTDTRSGKEVTFYVSLPEKYHSAFGRHLFYKLHFLRSSFYTIDYKEQFVGFITHHKTEYRPTYVGSVIGFRKK